MAKILVAGGSGYIGEWTITTFQKLDPSLRILNLDLATGTDLTDCQSLKTLDLTDVSCVFFFCGMKRIDESVLFPAKYYQNNINSLTNLLQELEERSTCRSLVFASSASVYFNESQLSPYAFTKMFSERLLQNLVQNAGWKVIVFRYFNIAGNERSNSDTLLGRIIQCGKRGQELRIFGDGTSTRDYLHVEDLAVLHWHAMNHLASQTKPTFQAFDVGRGISVSINDLLETFERTNGMSLQTKFTSMRPFEIQHSVANVTDLHRVFPQWRPERTLEHIVAM